MSDGIYEIHYLGSLAPGMRLEEVASRFAKLAKLSEDKALQMLNGPARIIKANLTHDQVQRYQSALHQAGLQFEVRRADSQPPPTTAAEACLDSTAADTSLSAQHYPVQFSGQSMEYFRIWIVNVLLSIITLGIYSAWAKVRNQQYFYSNTSIDGASFNYTAKPIAILKGRLIAVSLFATYALVNQFVPIAGLVLSLLIVPIIPWLIIQSLAFNARNSVYRNVPFQFQANYGEAVKVFILVPLLILPTLGLILPYIWYRQGRFFVEHSRYGTTPFEFTVSLKHYWQLFFQAFAIIIGGGIVAALTSVFDAEIVGMVIMFPVYLFFIVYLTTQLKNTLFNGSLLSDNRFESRLNPGTMLWLYTTNTLAIIFTLGLMIPWAKIRMARYRAQCLTVKSKSGLDNFAAGEREKVSALGEQIGEVFDMDISII